MLACVSGEHIKKMELTASSGKRQDFMKYTFEDAFCTKNTVGSGPGDEMPMEEVSFNFGKVTLEYKQQGALDYLRAAWDFIANRIF